MDPTSDFRDNAVDAVVVGDPAHVAAWKAFGQWLKDRRDADGLTRVEVAGAADLSPSTLATLEAGGRNYKGRWVLPSPEDRTLVKLAFALNTAPHVLFGQLNREVPRALMREYVPPPLPESDSRERLRRNQDVGHYRPSAGELRAKDPAFQKTAEKLSDEDWQRIKDMAERLLGEST